MCTCCFFGHSHIYDKYEVFTRVCKKVEELIDGGISKFLFGGSGEFDELCLRVVDMWKRAFPHIKTIYVQTFYNPTDAKTDILKAQYDEVVHLNIENVPKNLAVIQRNDEMINMSDFCVFYIDKNSGGAYKAYEYAAQKKKPMINMAK